MILRGMLLFSARMKSLFFVKSPPAAAACTVRVHCIEHGLLDGDSITNYRPLSVSMFVHGQNIYLFVSFSCYFISNFVTVFICFCVQISLSFFMFDAGNDLEK